MPLNQQISANSFLSTKIAHNKTSAILFSSGESWTKIRNTAYKLTTGRNVDNDILYKNAFKYGLVSHFSKKGRKENKIYKG